MMFTSVDTANNTKKYKNNRIFIIRNPTKIEGCRVLRKTFKKVCKKVLTLIKTCAKINNVPSKSWEH